jgi:hypothetical protein
MYIIFNILTTKGTVLVYSNYVEMEGLHIFKIYLQFFGFIGLENDTQFNITNFDDKYDNDTSLLDNFIALFNINTYLFHEEPVNKINKKLGTIAFIHLNKKYAAYYSITYPKIVYNDELFDDLREWIKYIKKNNQKNIIISNFLKL